jgi:hypothetical protein
VANQQLPVAFAHRIKRRSIRKVVQWLIRGKLPDGVFYRRERTQDKKLPSFESYYQYLYLKHVYGETNMRGPQSFPNSKQFSKHVMQMTSLLDVEQVRRVFFSMAPSACQLEAHTNGFNLLTFSIKDGVLIEIAGEMYRFEGAGFNKTNPIRVDLVDRSIKEM